MTDNVNFLPEPSSEKKAQIIVDTVRDALRSKGAAVTYVHHNDVFVTMDVNGFDLTLPLAIDSLDTSTLRKYNWRK